MGVNDVKKDSTLDILNQQLTKISAKNQYVTFLIGEEEYGIDIMLVQEIIRYMKPTKVSKANPVIEGIINFRGRVIPFINMHKKFNLPSVEYGRYTVVIILKANKKTMGMIVDEVLDILSFEDDDIQMVDQEFVDDIKTEHIKGMAKLKDRIILLMDPDRVLSFKEIEALKRIHGENVEDVKEDSR